MRIEVAMAQMVTITVFMERSGRIQTRLDSGPRGSDQGNDTGIAMTNLHRSPPMNQSKTDLGIVHESQLLRFGITANNADFSHAELNGATLNHCQLQNAKFTKAFIAAEFDSSDIRGADFGGSHILA